MQTIEDSSMLVPFIIGVSGHRDIDNTTIEMLRVRIKEILKNFQIKYPHLPVKLLTPLAEGADRIAAKVALELNIELVVPLPMPYDEYVKDFSSVKSKVEFDELLSRTAHHFELWEVYHASEKMDWGIKENRDLCYLQVGLYIAKHSQVLIALWDGQESEAIGGTSSIVKYKLNGIEDEKITSEDSLSQIESGPVYHVLTPRKVNTNIGNNIFSLNIYYPPFWKETSKADLFYKKIFESMNMLNKDILNSKELIVNEKLQFDSNLSWIYNNTDNFGKLLCKHLLATDFLAQKYKLYRTLALKLLLSSGVLSFISFHLYLSLFPQVFILALNPILLGIGSIIYLLAHKKGYEIKHEDYRSLSEALRVQIFWNLYRTNENVSYYFLRKHKGELEWIKYALRNWTLAEFSKPSSIKEESKDKRHINNFLLKYWVEDQRDWYFTQTNTNQRKHKNLKYIANYLFSAGVIFAIFLIAFELFRNQLFPSIEAKFIIHIFVLLIGLSFICATAIHGYNEKMIFPEQAKQYDRMYNLFDFVSEKIKNLIRTDNFSNLDNIFIELGKESLIENSDWLLIHRSRPLEMPKS